MWRTREKKENQPHRLHVNLQIESPPQKKKNRVGNQYINEKSLELKKNFQIHKVHWNSEMYTSTEAWC